MTYKYKNINIGDKVFNIKWCKNYDYHLKKYKYYFYYYIDNIEYHFYGEIPMWSKLDDIDLFYILEEGIFINLKKEISYRIKGLNK